MDDDLENTLKARHLLNKNLKKPHKLIEPSLLPNFMQKICMELCSGCFGVTKFFTVFLSVSHLKHVVYSTLWQVELQTNMF